MNLPFAVGACAAGGSSSGSTRARPADWDSGWYLARHLGLQPPVGVINVASSCCWWPSWPDVVGEATTRARLPAVAADLPDARAFLLVGKVYSPQFSLWLLPWLVLVLPGPRRFLAFEAADLAVFLTRFSFFGELTGVGGLPQWVFEVASWSGGRARVVRGGVGPRAEPAAADRGSAARPIPVGRA